MTQSICAILQKFEMYNWNVMYKWNKMYKMYNLYIMYNVVRAVSGAHKLSCKFMQNVMQTNYYGAIYNACNTSATMINIVCRKVFIENTVQWGLKYNIIIIGPRLQGRH